MAIPNRISSEISGEASAAVNAALQSIGGQMPFLIDLKPDERETLHHLKAGNTQFVQNTVTLVNKETGFLPRSFDIAEFKKDVELFTALHDIHHNVAALLRCIEDTMTIAGSEAYAAALAVYNYAKSKNIATPGLDPYVDDLARRFSRKSRNNEPPAKTA